MTEPVQPVAATIAGPFPVPQPPAPAPVLAHATRQIDKATLVPLDVPAPPTGSAAVKSGFVRQLRLQPGEVAEVRDGLRTAAGILPDGGTPVPDSLLDLLESHEKAAVPALQPQASRYADVPVEALAAFGRTLVAVRQRRLGQSAAARDDAAAGAASQLLHTAALATKSLEIQTTASPLGMLNLERLEMAPAGIERGELVATIPLAPLEETAVTQKEWSVQTKEFTSIVTDSLESFSETGVTDNTELSQSTTSQQSHSNQFNITGTVSGGIPVISGSVSSTFTGQSSGSESATDSRKHATALTQKASSRSLQEHKVTIATTTVTGSSDTTTRVLKNPSDTDPIRIDYFSLMRKWRVRLYRYGLRLTYDIVVPEPAAAMRGAYKELESLQNQLGPFVFPVSHGDITAEVRTGDPQPPVTDPVTPPLPHFKVLADRYGAQVPEPPQGVIKQTYRVDDQVPGDARGSATVTVTGEAGYQIQSITISGRMTSQAGHKGQFTVEGSNISFDESWDFKDFPSSLLLNASGQGNFMAGFNVPQTVLMTFDRVTTASLELTVTLVPSELRMEQWKDDVWGALYNAAQTQYYAIQQDISNKVTALQDKLDNVDTLTLRREESDEIMKSVLRFLLGVDFAFMPQQVIDAFKTAGVDTQHGIGFDGNSLGFDSTVWATVRQHEDVIRFVNDAIEWENVVSFLYSYFWDVPDSWPFIRDLRHPDANRQAFLRAGSARVVLTVRKGWEEKWVRFVETGSIDGSGNPADPGYLSIAREIAAYDDRNYPGIAPANPGKTATRLEDAVYATSVTAVAASANPVSIKVDSSDGFLVGATVVIDAVADVQNVQESQVITRIPDSTHIEVARLLHPHGGPSAPFPLVQPGEKGVVIAEWNEYTPTSGTDIAVTSNLATIA